MKSRIESVLKHNERIYYGADSNGISHDKKWLFFKKNGSHQDKGQVLTILTGAGEIQEAFIYNTRDEAYAAEREKIPSQGIMA